MQTIIVALKATPVVISLRQLTKLIIFHPDTTVLALFLLEHKHLQARMIRSN